MVKQMLRAVALWAIPLAFLAAVSWVGGYSLLWLAEHVWLGFAVIGIVFELGIIAAMVWYFVWTFRDDIHSRDRKRF